MSFNNPFTNLKLDGDKYNGFYRAIVRNSFDPLTLSRVKVEVLPMMKDIDVEDLPWAIPMDESNRMRVPQEGLTLWVFFEGGDIYKPVYMNCGGTLPITNKEDFANDLTDDTKFKHKWKRMVAGDIINAQGVADHYRDQEERQLISSKRVPPLVTDEVLPEDQTTQYPYNDIFLSPGGFLIELDDTPNYQRMRIHHPKGSYVIFDEDGGVHVHCEDKMQLYSRDQIRIRTLETLRIDAEHAINIETHDNPCPITIKSGESSNIVIKSGGKIHLNP